MAMTLAQDHATIPIGRRLAIVVDEPCIREFKFNDKYGHVTHFLARGQNNELIECSAYFDRALLAVRQLNVGDRVVADLQVRITAVADQLEYKYTGTFICKDAFASERLA